MISILEYLAPTQLSSIRCRECARVLDDLLPRSVLDAGFVPYCGVKCMPEPPETKAPKTTAR